MKQADSSSVKDLTLIEDLEEAKLIPITLEEAMLIPEIFLKISSVNMDLENIQKEET